jgi:hypothetical protein
MGLAMYGKHSPLQEAVRLSPSTERMIGLDFYCPAATFHT